jgi:hypothetical protein
MPTPIPYTVEAIDGAGLAVPTSMLAQPMLFPASYAVEAIGDAGGSKSLPYAGLTARVYLAGAVSGSGIDETDPLELLQATEDNLGPSWTVRMGADGRVRIRYVGSGVGGINWGTGIAVGRALGFVEDISLLEGDAAVAPYAPMGVVYLRARERATDWTLRAAGMSASLAGNGRVAARSDGRHLLTQTFLSRVHPRTWDEAVEYGSFVTPLHARDASPLRRLRPSGPLGLAPPWSVHEFVATAAGRRIAFALGTFQELVAGARDDFEVGYLLPEMLRATATPKSAGNWRAFRDCEFGLSCVAGRDPDGTERR